MSRKSNISLSNRALFYPSRKETLQLHEESQNSNVVKRDLSKQGTANSNFPNLPKLRYGWPRRGLSCLKVRARSHAVGDGKQPNKSNIPSVTPPIFKAKVWTTQAKSNQYNLSYFRRVFSRCSSATSLASEGSPRCSLREQHFGSLSANSRCNSSFAHVQTFGLFLPGTEFRLPPTGVRVRGATSLLCEAKSGCSRRPSVARMAQKAPEHHFRLDSKESTESGVLGSSETRFGPEGLKHLWLLRNPRDISVQWLERLGFTFSPFAFIFGTTFFFAALASTLQKQTGKQWLETLSHTKLPGLTANKVSQMSSWVFLESVLSQYINRDNSLLVSTRPLWGQPERSSGNSLSPLLSGAEHATDSAKLRKTLSRTPTFVQGKPTIGAVQLGGAVKIQLSPIWSQHLKKDFLGVFPLRQTNVAGSQFDKGSAPFGRARSIERSLNESVSTPRSTGRLDCLRNAKRGFVKPAQSSTDQSTVRAPVAGSNKIEAFVRESQKTLIWPWYQIMAYHSPNRLIFSTWTDNTITKATVSLRNNTLVPTAVTKSAADAASVLFEEESKRAPIGWSEGPHNNFDMSVERLRLEDDSIPSKKDSIYSKKKIHQDTLSARVLNVVKKSFYDYGFSIPGSAQPQNVLPSSRVELLLQAPTGPSRTKPEVLLAERGSASAPRLGENGSATQSFRPEKNLDKFVESKNDNLSLFGKDSVNRQILAYSLPPRHGATAELTSANWTSGARVASEGLESKREQTVGLLRNEVSVLGRNLNKSEFLRKPAQSNCQEKPNLDGVLNVTDQRETLRETEKLSKTGRRRDRISGSKPLRGQGLRSKASERSSKSSLLCSTKSGINKPSVCSALIFRNIAIPKRSFWEYAHSISGYNFPELQDYEVAYLFRPKLRFGCPPFGGLKVAASTQSKVGVVTLLNEARRRHGKFGKADKLALTTPSNSRFGIHTNQVFLTPYLAKVPPKVLLTASNKTEGLTPQKTATCSHFCSAKLTGTSFRFPHVQTEGLFLTERGASSEHQADLGFALEFPSGRAITNPRFVRAVDQLSSPTINGESRSQPFASPSRGFQPSDGAISTEQAKLGVPETFVEVGSNAQGLEVGKADRRHEQPVADNFTIRYTPLELEQENKVKKAFKELGRDYSDYLNQPKDSLPALLLSPSLEEDKQIEEEEVRRLAQEKAAAKAAAKRTQNEEENSLGDSATNEEDFNILALDPSDQTELRSAIEVALRESKNSASNLEEEPLNEEEIEDSRFERLRFTREVETKKEEEDCRGLALSLICRDSNVPIAELVGANKTKGFVRRPGLDKINDKLTGRLLRELLPPSGPLLTSFGGNRNEVPVKNKPKVCTFGQPERSSGQEQTEGLYVRTTGTKFRSILRSKSARTAPLTNLRFVQADSSSLKMSRMGTIESPRVSARKHSFFGQRSFWPTRLFSQEERLVSAHIVNPFILYDQSNPWLIPDQGGGFPVTSETKPTANWPTLRSTLVSTSPATSDEGQLLTLRSKVCKTDHLQNLKNLQTQARLGLVRFVHLPVVEAALVTGQSRTLLSESNPQGRATRSGGGLGGSDRRAQLSLSASAQPKVGRSAEHGVNLSSAKLLIPPKRITPIVDFAAPGFAPQSLTVSQHKQSVTQKAGNQNRIYKPDPRLRLTPLESSISADWRNDRKVEASPFRVTSKERPHIVLPQLNENEWQKSLEWQLKRHFLDEDTRLEPLVATEPYKTFKVKRIDRSLPWLTLEKPTFKLFQWPYKPVGVLQIGDLQERGQFSVLNPSVPSSASSVALEKATPRRTTPGRSDLSRAKGLPATLFEEELSTLPPFRLVNSSRISVAPPTLAPFWHPSGTLLTSFGGNRNEVPVKNKPSVCTFGQPERSSGQEQIEGLYVRATAPFTNLRFVQAGSCKSPICSCPISLASSLTTYSKDRSALSVGSNPLFDVTKKLFSSQDNVNTELLFERPSTSSWFLIYRLFLALILKEVLKYIYRISLKDFFIRIINSDFGRTITSPEFRQSVQFEPFSEFYKPKNRLKDLIGIKNALLPLSEIIWFLRNNCRSRNGPHGVILLGPEGVDGTAIAQAVAGEAKVPIIVQSLRALTLTHSHPQKRLEKVLLLARAQSPCVLFLDELDVIGQAREGVIRNTSGDGNSLISLDSSQFANGQPQLQPPLLSEAEQDQAISQGRRVDLMLRLLTVMDGLHHLNGVVIITTSKNTATLDPALLRPGRFDRLIHLTLPNHEHRMELFKVKTRELGHTDQMSLDERNSLLSVAELEYLSHRTANMGGADIVSAINYSTLRAIVNHTVHTIETLEYGLNCVKALKDKQSVALARRAQR